MPLKLYIPPCIHDPPHCFHPPPVNKPLRIQIQGPLETIQKLLPNESWHPIAPFPQPGGLKLANLTYQTLYGQDGANDALLVRDEYLAWVMHGRRPTDYIDYYGITFDYLVPTDDPNPEVLAISIIEVDNDGGAFANDVLSFSIDPTEYTGKRVLAVPRCCQDKKGTQDRGRVNGLVAERDGEIRTQDVTAKRDVKESNMPNVLLAWAAAGLVMASMAIHYLYLGQFLWGDIYSWLLEANELPDTKTSPRAWIAF